MRRCVLHGPLTAVGVRRVRRAVREATRAGKPPNMALTVHPGRLEQPPADFRRFFQRKVINWLGDWFRGQDHQWSALWIRENYAGLNREHLHMLLHVPRHLRRKLARALARRWPEPEVADLMPVYDGGAVFYILKQRTPQAHYALGFRGRRERHCRHDQAPVAAVLGPRVGMTRDLERLVRALEL